MQSFITAAATWTVLLAAAGTAAVTPSSHASIRTAAPVAKFSVAETASAAAAVAAVKAATPVRKPVATSQSAVRSLMKYDTVRWGGKPVRTLDEASRVLLAQAAARQAGLQEVGLSYHDVYGIIEAETSWIPRTGSSKDGTPNLGLAQFEPRTARGLGIADPSDPVQAVFGAAMYMKEGAQWASKRLAPQKLAPALHAAKLREGVSVYYNLSIKGRNKWTGFNTAQLPIETQRHIRNARAGAAEAMQLARVLSA